jgi:tetratricopeptide (TPR) repeat protein
VGIVLSTVAVNLKDCAPFASKHRPDLSEPAKAAWENLYRLGMAAQTATNIDGAASHFREAAQIDDTFADLHYRQAECALALGNSSDARQQFEQARDLDTLRFRCDRRLNDLIRETGGNRRSDRVLLADAERAFAQASPDGLPGENLFYEHVHPNFMGNYLLAQTIAGQVEALLPEGASGARPWPTAEDCARRLAWSDWARLDAEESILARVEEAPFTGQLNHAAQLQRVLALLDKLRPATSPQGLAVARKACDAALAGAPDDPALYAQLASLQELAGDLSGAADSVRHSLELLPSSAAQWETLGEILLRLRQPETAADALERSLALDPADEQALAFLAQTMTTLGRREEAIRDYRRAVRLQPRFSVAWIGLGQAYETAGLKAAAEDCYRKALAGHLYTWEPELLARFCQGRGWLEAAATNYASAIQVKPLDASLRMAAGENLVALKRYAEAGGQFGEAALLEPEMAEAHYLYGSALGMQGEAAAAAQQFSLALQLKPELLDARLNLGVALMHLGRDAEALAQFEDILQRSPTNASALQAVQFLRARTSPGEKR